MVSDGKIKPQVDRVFSLQQIREAHVHLQQGKAKGKVVLSHSTLA